MEILLQIYIKISHWKDFFVYSFGYFFFPFTYLFLKKKEGSRRTSNHQMPESFAGMKSSGTGTSWLLCFSIAHSFDVTAAAATAS